MQYIKKLKLENFKRFKSLEVDFKEGINTIVGDNESGKSSIIQAIDLVAKGSRSRVETIGIESLLTKEACNDFIQLTQKSISDLPEIHVEIFLNEDSKSELTGKHNSDNINTAGLHLIIKPNDDLSKEINQLLAQNPSCFPFEFYIVNFVTFSGESYSGYSRFLSTLTIDNSQISSEYANREYTKTVYYSTVNDVQRVQLKNEYRQHKESFSANHLTSINSSMVGNYDFAIRSSSKSNLETDIGLIEDSIPIDERGKGQQCFIKTEFVLSQSSNRNIDVLLLEEPENHLSHTNMKRLVSRISDSEQNQIIIATHNSLISSRLDLRNSILLNSTGISIATLKKLSTDTAKFFMKAPDNNILEFILSTKVILVEGDAEYMLFETLYHTQSRNLEDDAIHIISVDGLSFKRYLDLAKILNIRVAVIRDNDGDAQKNCITNYAEYPEDNISIFYDSDDAARTTFEICVYEDNKGFCDNLFNNGSIQKPPLDYMLDNKAEAAYRIAEKCDSDEVFLKVPDYIERAIVWINE